MNGPASTNASAAATQANLANQMDQFQAIAAQQEIQKAQNVLNQGALDMLAEQASAMAKGKDKIQY